MRVMAAFAEALQAPRLEPGSDFFAAGGDSLSAAAAANKLGIEPALLPAFPTARRLARYLAGEQCL